MYIFYCRTEEERGVNFGNIHVDVPALHGKYMKKCEDYNIVKAENEILKRVSDGLRNTVGCIRKKLDSSEEALTAAQIRISALEAQSASQLRQLQDVYERLGAAMRLAAAERDLKEKYCAELEKYKSPF
jgi:conjugal transfer/entry exclusion protein